MVLLAANQTWLANLQGVLTTTKAPTHHSRLTTGVPGLQGRALHGAIGMPPLLKRY